MENYSKYLVSQSVSGGKYWEVEVENSELRIRYGKLGQEKAWSTKEFDSYDDALKEAEKKLKGKLRKGYVEAPRPSAVAETTDVSLAEETFAGVFYFRAQDRFPGGNADMWTTKITLIHEPGKPPVVVACAHNDWDGEHWVYPEAPVNLPFDQSLPALIESAQNLIEQGLNDVSFTVHDDRYDDEAYDTEWSWLEFTITRLPAGSPTTPIDQGETLLRFQQKAVYGTATAAEPDDLSQSFLDSVKEFAGISTVDKYSENTDAFSSAFKSEGTSLGYVSTPVPLYL